MPGYKGHLVGGTMVFALVAYMVSFYYAPTGLIGLEWLLFALAGALFPDVDVKSKGQNYFYWILFVLILLLLLLEQWKTAALVSIVAFVPLLVRHRGIFHRAWFIAFLSLSSLAAVSFYLPAHANRLSFDILFFMAGALSHLWLDLGLRKMFRW